MTKPCPALSVLLMVATLAACERANTAEPRAGGPEANKPAVEQPGPGTTAASVTPEGQPINPLGAATIEFQKRI